MPTDTTPELANAKGAALVAEREPKRAFTDGYVIKDDEILFVRAFSCEPNSPGACFVPGVGSMSNNDLHADLHAAQASLRTELEHKLKYLRSEIESVTERLTALA